MELLWLVRRSLHGRIKLEKYKYETDKIQDPFNWAKAIEEKNKVYSLFSKLNEEKIIQELLIMKLRLLKELDLYDLYKFQKIQLRK